MEEQINLNGEFLGISALAIYSAPWFLQLPLLALVATLFFLKITSHSTAIRKLTSQPEAHAVNDLDRVLSNVNYAFFGFAVPRKNLSAYWTGFSIYVITFLYAAINSYWMMFS